MPGGPATAAAQRRTSGGRTRGAGPTAEGVLSRNDCVTGGHTQAAHLVLAVVAAGPADVMNVQPGGRGVGLARVWPSCGSFHGWGSAMRQPAVVISVCMVFQKGSELRAARLRTSA